MKTWLAMSFAFFYDGGQKLLSRFMMVKRSITYKGQSRMLFYKAGLLLTSVAVLAGCSSTFYIDVKNMTNQPVSYIDANGGNSNIAPDASSKEIYSFNCIRFERDGTLYEFNSDVSFPLRYDEVDLIEDGFNAAIVESEAQSKDADKLPLRFLMDDGLGGTIELKEGCNAGIREALFTGDLANF